MTAHRRFSGEVTFVVGPEKTATTFIQHLLEQHPDIALPQGIKETFFFDRFYDNGFDWYLDRFRLNGAGRYLVEVAPSYFCTEEAVARISRHFPQARIVICVRDPVDRTLSHFRHLKRYGYARGSLLGNLDPDERPLKSSFYQRYGTMWEAAFGADRVKVLDIRRQAEDPAGFAAAVFDAVGVRRIDLPEAALTERSNEAVEPGNYLLARLATLVSNTMKRHGFYRVLEFFRRSPVHRLVYGSRKANGGGGASAAERAHLRALLAHEYAFLAEHYGIDYRDGEAGSPAAEASGRVYRAS